jgi:hypothetical protein
MKETMDSLASRLVVAIDGVPVPPRPDLRSPRRRAILLPRLALVGLSLTLGLALASAVVWQAILPLASAGQAASRESTTAGWSETEATSQVIARLARAGLSAREQPAAPSALLLFNAKSIQLLAVDDARVLGLAIYRYGSSDEARRGMALTDPTKNQIEWAAPPYFVQVDDVIVSFATSDSTLAQRVTAALSGN